MASFLENYMKMKKILWRLVSPTLQAMLAVDPLTHKLSHALVGVEIKVKSVPFCVTDRCSYWLSYSYLYCYIQVPEQFKSSKLINSGNKSKSILFFVSFIVDSQHRVQVSRKTSHSDLNPDLSNTSQFNTSGNSFTDSFSCDSLLPSVVTYIEIFIYIGTSTCM